MRIAGVALFSKTSFLFLASCLTVGFSSEALQADIFKYEDKNGKVHYVDSESKIPEEYKKNVEDQKVFPGISKVSSAKNSDSIQSEAQENREEETVKTEGTTARTTVTTSSATTSSTDNKTVAEDSSTSNVSMPIDQVKLEIFVADWCGHCRALEKALKDENIAYERFDIEKSDEGKREYGRLGRGGIPISRINGSKIVRGNNLSKIKETMRNAS